MEINDGYLNQRNYRVVNEFLSSLKNANYKEKSINEHRRRLRFFFKDRKEEFTIIKQDDIKKWVEKLRGYQKEKNLQANVSALRAFYKFCIKVNYVKESPVMEGKKRTAKGGQSVLKKVLPNEINQNTVNEYLGDIESSGRSEFVIVHYRTKLQRFFISFRKPYSSITEKDIEQWIDKYRNKWSTKTTSNYYHVIRSFFTFCEKKGYIETMPIKKNRWVAVAEKYWEIQQPIANLENLVVLNEFLLHLKDEGYSKKTIVSTRVTLQVFFRRRKERFSSINSEEVYLWLGKKLKINEEDSNFVYVGFIRNFYRYCVWKGYMERSPVIHKPEWKKRGEKSWVLKKTLTNARNQEVINEFLLSMRVANLSEGTIINYRNFLSAFFQKKEESFDSLTSDSILTWLIKLQNEIKESTVCSYLSMLNSFFRFCVEEEYMEKSYIKMRWFPRIPNSIPKFLEKHEVAKIHLMCESVDIRKRAILEFFFATGCRIGEVPGLDKEHIDFENRTAIVTGKGKKIRTVHFTEKCSLLIEKYLATRTDNLPPLFASKWGERIKPSYIRKIVRELGESASLTTPLHPHRIRHTFATELLVKGASLSFIADELGHKDLKVTQIYARFPKQEILSMYRKYMG